MTEQDQLRARNRELSILNTIAQALNQQVDLSKALITALQQIVDLFNLQTGWVWLLDEVSREPYLAASHNLPPALASAPDLMAGTRYCYCLDSYQSGDMPAAENISIITCSRLKDLITGTDGLRNHASVPLQAHGKSLGLLNVVGADWRELSSDELRLLHIIGDMLGIAVERALLFADRARFGMLEERNRLAREIHDTLAQALAAISFRLEAADALLDNGVEYKQVHALVMESLHLTQTTLDDARRSVLDLRASPLEDLSLPDAIKALCETHQQETATIDIKVKLGDLRPLPPRVEMAIYRMVQEGLNNILRHANAQQAVVDITLNTETVNISIQDDGVGFDVTQMSNNNRLGLVGINERVHLLGGNLNVESTLGVGTSLQIQIPLEGIK